MVRVPRAWGDGGEAMAESAWLDLPFPEAVVLVGARNLDPPEEEFIRSSGLHLGEEAIADALEGAACTYVALDVDVLEPSQMSVWMPEPAGPSRADVERVLRAVANRTNVLG